MLKKTHRHLPHSASATEERRSFSDGDARRMDGPRSQSVDPGVRAELEESFGHRFDDVRIWPGDSPWATPESLGADAYAVGRDVVFADGAYEPQTVEGRFLLAHELAHVVQQSRGPHDDEPPALGDPASAAESDASAAAIEAVSGGKAQVQVVAPPTVARGMFDMFKHLVEPLGGGASDGAHQHEAAHANDRARDTYAHASHEGLISQFEGRDIASSRRNAGTMERQFAHDGRLTAHEQSHLSGAGHKPDGLGGLFGGIGNIIGGGISSLAGLVGGPFGFNPLDLFGSKDGLRATQDESANAGEMNSFRMQQMVQRRAEMFELMSDVMKRRDDTARGTIQNLR